MRAFLSGEKYFFVKNARRGKAPWRVRNSFLLFIVGKVVFGAKNVESESRQISALRTYLGACFFRFCFFAAGRSDRRGGKNAVLGHIFAALFCNLSQRYVKLLKYSIF